MQDYTKAHIPLPYVEKRRKSERTYYRIALITGPAGNLIVFAIRVAIGNVPLSWLFVLASLIGTAVGVAACLAVMWVWFRIKWMRSQRRRAL